MALTYKSLNELTAKTLKFTDEFFSLTGEYVSGEDCFPYIGYDVLKDVYDIKTNNFSNIALSKKFKNSDILKITDEKNNTLSGYSSVSTLSFFSSDETDKMNPGAWLCFNKSYNSTWDSDGEATALTITVGKPNSYSAYVFNVICNEEDNTCQIGHNYAGVTYYLSYDEEKETFYFISNNKDESTKFLFHTSDDILRLYKKIGDKLYSISCLKDSIKYYLSLNEYNGESKAADNIYITKTNEEFNYYLNASWIKYDRSNKIDAVDKGNSTFTLDSQFIIHHEYATSSDVNIIPLKNHLTYQGSVVNGSNLVISTDGTMIKEPQVNYRTYTSLHTGNNQEYGNENIILTFSFNDQEYHIEDGEECVFTIAEREEGSIEPLYPYKKLNINDSAFVRNGAFASDTPYYADKFKKLQNKNITFNTGYYLCTWLYQPSEDATPLWLDRYYYPDMIHRRKALKQSANGVFMGSFNNIPDKIYDESNQELQNYDEYILEDINNFKKALQNNTYVDKLSDVTIEPGTSYSYIRIGSDMVEEEYEKLAENRIDIVKDQKLNDVLLETKFDFNGENWRKIQGEDFKKASAINFNANVYINPKQKMGLQLFGSDYKSGCNIQNRKDLAPFHYYASESTVFMLNNKYEIRQSFNIYQTYGVNIKDIIISEPFEDIYIITDDSIFIMEYDLKLKIRILFKDIQNLSEILKNEPLYILPVDDSESIGTVITKEPALLYNGNLYFGLNVGTYTTILKIVINPDSDLDEGKLTARCLKKTEYSTNFSESYDDSLIQTTPTIKSLFADKEGNIYAFNYHQMKMTFDGDTIYGIYNNYEDVIDKWYYVFNQSISKLKISSASSKYAEFSSDVSIDNIASNPKGEIAMIRGFSANATTGEINDEEKCLEIYNRTKTKIYNYPLGNFDKVVALDYYSYIDETHTEQMVFAAVVSAGDRISVIEYQSNYEKIKTHYTSLVEVPIDNFRQCTCSNALVDRYEENKLYFNLYLPGPITKEKLTIEWDLLESQEGWYNINMEVDMDNAIFRVKINDEVYGEISYLTNSSFMRYTHTNTSIFENSYYIGTIGKEYGTTLHEILSDLLYDPYALKNSKIENITLYNKKLAYHEYQITRLHFTKINPLVITLPCGIRNGVEEIIRYFKYRNPGYITSKIKLNISGIPNIKYESEVNALKKKILSALENNGDCLIKVKEIEFI